MTTPGATPAAPEDGQGLNLGDTEEFPPAQQGHPVQVPVPEGDDDDAIFMGDVKVGTPVAKRGLSPNNVDKQNSRTPPKVTRAREKSDVQTEILGAIHRLTSMQFDQGKAAEGRHLEILKWQEESRNEHNQFKTVVENKFQDVDNAIDEIRVNTARALSLAEEATKVRQEGGDPAALATMLKETEERLSKFVIEEVQKATVHGRPAQQASGSGSGPSRQAPGSSRWSDRQEDHGVLVGGFPVHTRSAKVEEVLNFMCTKLGVNPMEKFSLGKRTQYGMLKMATRDEAWAVIKQIKESKDDFMGMQLWATKSYPKEERDRTQGLRRAAWAIRKATGPGVKLDMDVDYSRLKLFLGDHLVGTTSSSSEFIFDDSEWAKAMPALPLQRVRDILKEAFTSAS